MKTTHYILALCLLVITLSVVGLTRALRNDCCTSEENAVIEAIMARRSIRAYTDESVSRELLDKIAECGINAPNGMNAQQWEVRIVDSKEWLDKATAAYREGVKGTPAEKQFEEPSFKNMFRNAPAVIFVAHKPGHCTQVDCGLMAGNMMLAAQSLGLGSICMMGPLMWLNSDAGKPVIETLGFSEGYEPLLCVGIGYAAEQPDARPRNKEVIKYVE
ncbi:MAG: nitroreductase family protein [Rikenellaceae bacterium]|nr:nitroreductase family protein [Rikenellaceae bacterium]